METIRRELRARRRDVERGSQLAASAEVVARTAALLEGTRSLGAYIAVRGEIDPAALVEAAWRQDVAVFAPRVMARNTMVFARWSADSVAHESAFGTPEPPETAEIRAASRLDAVLVPVVAFDDTGTRVGSGAGFYDRAFAFRLMQPRGSRPLLIGLAYSWQQVDHIERRPWDVPLDLVVTDQRVIEPRHSN